MLASFSMETRASNRKKPILQEDKEITKDRISDLPDAILELIFSFLPAKSIARTSILSKRWRHLWPSYPCLDFSTFQCRIPIDPRNPPNATMIHDIKTKAVEFLPTVLARRHENSKIKIFRLTGHISLSCLQNSICRLVSQGIEELDLDLFLSNDFILPRPLLACHSLRVLSLKANKLFRCPDLINFRFPTAHVISSSGFQSIQSLSLTNVCFMDSLSVSDLFSASTFPLLKKLHLKECQVSANININCPRLEYLDLDHLRLHGLGVFGAKLEILRVFRCFWIHNDQTWLKILAPRLRIFHLECNAFTQRCFMKSFTSLVRGSIYFVNEMISAARLRCAAYLISMFAFAKHLYLGTLVVELLSKMDGGLPISFNNLVNLELHTGLNRSDIPGIACLLRSCPSLNKLSVEIDYMYRTANNRWDIDVLDSSNISEEQYWESESEALKSVQHLKVVAIKVLRGDEIYESWIKFVKFLLMYGIMLEEMSLSSKNSDIQDPPLWKRGIGSQIEKFPKASSHVKLIYV